MRGSDEALRGRSEVELDVEEEGASLEAAGGTLNLYGAAGRDARRGDGYSSSLAGGILSRGFCAGSGAAEIAEGLRRLIGERECADRSARAARSRQAAEPGNGDAEVDSLTAGDHGRLRYLRDDGRSVDAAGGDGSASDAHQQRNGSDRLQGESRGDCRGAAVSPPEIAGGLITQRDVGHGSLCGAENVERRPLNYCCGRAPGVGGGVVERRPDFHGHGLSFSPRKKTGGSRRTGRCGRERELTGFDGKGLIAELQAAGKPFAIHFGFHFPALLDGLLPGANIHCDRIGAGGRRPTEFDASEVECGVGEEVGVFGIAKLLV